MFHEARPYKRSTFREWFKLRAVQVTLIIIGLVSAGILFKPEILQPHKEFLTFFTELFGVASGIVLGFYWERANYTARFVEEIPKILNSFIEELEFNKEKIRYIYSSAGVTYLPNLQKTTTYELYKNKLTEINFNFIPELHQIYFNFTLINENLRKYPTTQDLDTYRSQRQDLVEIRTTTLQAINEWIPQAKEALSKFG
ncbi:MAG: hypothetical protein ACTSW1_10010 [Candidatus Hodarchaeales archaeon]